MLLYVEKQATLQAMIKAIAEKLDPQNNSALQQVSATSIITYQKLTV